ncbi:MAG: hypothetical protein QXT47_00745 [Desulfurococcaceae archaeon]
MLSKIWKLGPLTHSYARKYNSLGGLSMELSEKERLILVEKKEEIRRLTTEILDLASNPANATEIKKRFTSILAYLSTIASYSKPINFDLDRLTGFINLLFYFMNVKEDMWILSQVFIEAICNVINSIRFDFIGKSIKIHIPKIDINIPNINIENRI